LSSMLGCSTLISNKVAMDVAKGSEVFVEISIPSMDKMGGSGNYISEDGFVLTAAHVVSPYKNYMESTLLMGVSSIPHLVVIDNKGETRHATIVALDEDTDIAILSTKGSPHAWAPLATSPASVGDPVVLMSHPLLQNTILSTGILTSGVRSKKELSMHPEHQGLFEGQNAYSMSLYLGSGASGGGVLNDRGEIVCVVSWMYLRPPFTAYCADVQHVIDLIKEENIDVSTLH